LGYLTGSVPLHHYLGVLYRCAPMSAYPVGMNVQAKRVREVRQQSVCASCRGPILALGWCRTGCVTRQYPEAA
jgi:hypothetical protein